MKRFKKFIVCIFDIPYTTFIQNSETACLSVLHAGYFVMLLLSFMTPAHFFLYKLFEKTLSGTLSECNCQTVWIQIRNLRSVGTDLDSNCFTRCHDKSRHLPGKK